MDADEKGKRSDLSAPTAAADLVRLARFFNEVVVGKGGGALLESRAGPLGSPGTEESTSVSAATIVSAAAAGPSWRCPVSPLRLSDGSLSAGVSNH